MVFSTHATTLPPTAPAPSPRPPPRAQAAAQLASLERGLDAKVKAAVAAQAEAQALAQASAGTVRKSFPAVQQIKESERRRILVTGGAGFVGRCVERAWMRARAASPSPSPPGNWAVACRSAPADAWLGCERGIRPLRSTRPRTAATPCAPRQAASPAGSATPDTD